MADDHAAELAQMNTRKELLQAEYDNAVARLRAVHVQLDAGDADEETTAAEAELGQRLITLDRQISRLDDGIRALPAVAKARAALADPLA